MKTGGATTETVDRQGSRRYGHRDVPLSELRGESGSSRKQRKTKKNMKRGDYETGKIDSIAELRERGGGGGVNDQGGGG
jgi:hypothetical protein